MGDTPYGESEIGRLDRLIDDLNAAELAFVAHVGDVTSGRGPCSDEWLAARKAQFARLRHPFILLPGDNDWTDCHRSGFDPLERLNHWRSLFCHPRASFQIEEQKGPYCEHVRWQAGGWLFVALNVQGSNNNLGRTPAMDAEYAERMRAVFAWIDDSQKLFRGRKLEGMVLLMQANPFVTPRSGSNGFDSILKKLRELGAAYPGRIVLVNGDTHVYHNDEPIPGVHRLEVWGSPIVSWLRGAIVGGRLDAAPADAR
jgi:calcineurin-like phosphoesterase family protein